MTHTPGTFQPEEIQQIFNGGANIIAVKMLRVETDCSLQEAVDALKSGTVAEMPTFKTMRARRRAERYGPQLLEVLKRLRDRFFPADQKERDRDIQWGLVNDLIREVEMESHQ